MPFYLLAAALLAILAGVITYDFLHQLRLEAVPNHQVLVAKADIQPGELIDGLKIEAREVPEIVLPNGALTQQNQAVGRVAIAPIYADEVLHSNRLSGSGRSGISGILPEGSWAMVMPSDWLVSPIPELRNGERLDFLAYLPGEEMDSAGLLVSNVPVLNTDETDELTDRLILAVNMEQAKLFLFARANGYLLVPLLPAPKE